MKEKNITTSLSEIYLPQKALLVFVSEAEQRDVYVEAYDMDNKGYPINAHPLSKLEIMQLTEYFNAVKGVSRNYLSCEGLLPERLLTLDNNSGTAIWYTPAQKVNLLFAEALNIPCGQAWVPPLIWKAGKDKLYVHAFKGKEKPKKNTSLFYAPFFNLYGNGNVCMGTVDVDLGDVEDLYSFMEQWEGYFWKSYFSHVIGNGSPVNGDIVQLWQDLVKTKAPFPEGVLRKNGKKLNDLLNNEN